MLRRIVIAAALLGSPANAAPPRQVVVHMFGYSSQSCATLINNVTGATQMDATKLYVFGLWSGMNLGAQADVGGSTDANGIFAEVQLECQAHPSELLIAAVPVVWSHFKVQGR